MADLQITDPKAMSLQKKLKIAGAGAVAVAASGIIIVGGLGVIAACGVGLVALAAVNAVEPAARYIALKKQQALTALAETFSEETIREDERQEAERVKMLEEQYRTSCAELQGAQEELREQLDGADEATTELVNNQIATLQGVIDDGANTLQQRMEDLEDLRKANKLYIAFQRSAAAMLKAQGAERTAAERQRVEEARNAIKTRMRAAVAGKKIEAMREQAGSASKLSLKNVASLGVSRPVTLNQSITSKETSNVPRNR